MPLAGGETTHRTATTMPGKPRAKSQIAQEARKAGMGKRQPAAAEAAAGDGISILAA
jgi:hypothetical protein